MNLKIVKTKKKKIIVTFKFLYFHAWPTFSEHWDTGIAILILPDGANIEYGRNKQGISNEKKCDLTNRV